MSAGTPAAGGQAPGQAPEAYRRWCQVNQPANWTAPLDLIEAMWSEKTTAEQEFWRSLAAAPRPGAAVPGQADGGPEYAEFSHWMKAQGNDLHAYAEYGSNDMAEAFEAGMRAQRDLAAQEQPAPGGLLCDNKPVMEALMLALSDPGSVTPRAPLESLVSWQRRAVIEHAALPIAQAVAAGQVPPGQPQPAPSQTTPESPGGPSARAD